MKWAWIFFCIFLFSARVSAGGARFLFKDFRHEPTLTEVLNQVIKNEKLAMTQVDSWHKKMKQAPWLPTFSAGYDRSVRKQNDVTFSDNISVSTSGVVVGPEDSNFDESVYNGHVFRVRATWDLSHLVFHDSLLSASSQSRELTKLRLQVVDHVSKLYAERKELVLQYLKNNTKEPRAQAGQKIEILTGKLKY